MQGVLEEAVYEDRLVRRRIRQALRVFSGKIMQGYQDRRVYFYPQSQDEDYLSGWKMAEKN
jgi:hypothetical protein